jgi:diguanylate cyclase (GGDEF)-like protein
MSRVRGEMIRAAVLTLAGIALVLLLTGLATYVVLWYALVRPVQSLTETARALARGDLQRRAPAQRSDELAVLGSTFNDMADRLERYTRGLEEEIGVRTRELEDANRRLCEANAQLQGLATTDGLTGLFNYRHFTATMAAEIQRCRRLHNPVSMLMLDVDHFKHFNDSQGHPAGDEVLREIARHVQSRLRRTDVPCRYGGEEFAVILVAETLRDLIERSRFVGEEEQPGGRLTVSLGVATFPDDAVDADSLVKASDSALYRAKQAGRNRVAGAPQALASLQQDLPLEP